MTASHLLVNLLYSLAGGVVGYLLGRAGRAAVEHQAPRKLGERLQNLLGVLILIAVLVAGVAWHRQTQCQLEANRAYSAGTIELREAAEIDREANRVRWAFIREALANPVLDPTDQQRRERSARWLRDLERADALVVEAEAKRRASPPPVLRDCS